MKFPSYCQKCGVEIEPTIEGFLKHIRSKIHNLSFGAFGR